MRWRWPYPRFAAHRGAGKVAPENTLAALKLGTSFGYRMVEIDVKLSADGVAFLLHDSTLQRTTNGYGRADARTWRELALLDAGAWHSDPYAGEPLPTLAAVASFCRANHVLINIEIKSPMGRERETGAAVAIDAATLWQGADVPPLLSSFSEVSLAAAREAVPELPRALLADRLPVRWRKRCEALECVALDLKHTAIKQKLVDTVHAAGYSLLSWTVNDPKRAARLVGWGVDTVITDAVDLIAPEFEAST
ncbi:MAG TPA: glycerophosphodiester phosphodiesterase [Casimicrobiaceae bacterium]|nr:glycerophosphodiester phosphodiesterase [Casimicrobiaceae bacterium]